MLTNIHLVNHNAILRMVETLKLKGYSESTIRTYQYELAQFLIALKNNPVEQCDAQKVRSYLLYCYDHLKLAENTLHSRLNALKFYFEQVLHRDKMFFQDIPRPKKHSQLPKTIHASDIKKMFNVTANLKHNTMLKLCYGAGLRLSEIINIKIKDVDSKNMQVFIERGKGKKDRYVNLPHSILEQLRAYYKIYRPQKYLFEGQQGEQYAKRSLQNVFTNSLRKAGINKQVGIHGLRHSYATHLLEQGTDIRFIQELLGHKDLKTTLIYTDVTNHSIRGIASPLDRL
ncbi:MAG: site-specific integrase [Bacteroidales bacterium]|jgi:site-specific recombinase XerD|nr:site-specific integrase [Bacteroidales bacterium]